MRVRRALVEAGRGFAMAVIGMYAVVIGLFLGLVVPPVGRNLVQGYVRWRGRLAERWYGVTLPDCDAPPASVSTARDWLRYAHCLATDRTMRPALRFLAVDAVVGSVLALVPLALVAEGLFGFVLAAGVWRPIHDETGGDWYLFVHVTSQAAAFVAAGLGVVLLVLAYLVNPRIMTAHARLARFALTPNAAELAERVRRLTQTRSDAVDTAAAELRRIERDLHDGAQARLVAMGMNLGAAERLLDTDPERARAMLVEARESSATALAELRDLVRGIHPPVLSERGLGDAVRAFALSCPLPTDVEVDLPGRLPAPVESAAYFAVCEAVTNAVKHAGAKRVRVDLRYAEGVLRITVTEDGRGGADPGRGTGLSGVRRRLGTFDGTLNLMSPVGGPTVVIMELPCALYSPRTSSS